MGPTVGGGVESGGPVSRRISRIVLVLAGVAGVVWLGSSLGDRLPALLGRVEAAGATAPLLFGGVYVAAVIVMVPGSILTLAAGALFGVVRGTVVVFIAATLGASIAFLLARGLARPLVERRLRRDPRFERIDTAVGRNGWKVVFLLRLTPVVPFNLLNYALGATRVGFRDYVTASIGMLPGTVLYVYSGRAIGGLAAVAAGERVTAGPLGTAVFVLGLVATLLLVVLVTRVARDALRDEAGIVG
jgi:uncharacterized membrane protein YdjX (TVP38/TMEM64 family)